MSASPSNPTRWFRVSRSLEIELLDSTPRARLQAIKLMMAGIRAESGLDAEASLDSGLLQINDTVASRVYTVNLHVVVPVATLDDPDLNTVSFVGWSVIVPNGGNILSAERAQTSCFDRLRSWISAMVAVDAPLRGRIRMVLADDDS